jgi:RNA polymerase sigma factor (sigma-70 family)
MLESSDRFENFNRLAQDVLQYPMLKGSRLSEIFIALDKLIKQAVNQIVCVSTFVEDNICFQLAEIMLSAIKTKLHKGRWTKQREGVGEGVEIGAENARILGMGFDLFKLARTQREVAVPLLRRVFRTLRLNNLSYEQTLLAFSEATNNYCDIVDQLTTVALEISTEEDIIPKMQKMSELIDAKNYIEMTVGCVDSNHLYGVVAIVKKIKQKIKKMQEEVLKAHMRLIPKIVREHTQNDNDALDAFQAGSVGLLHAVTAYDYKSRTAFATFARYSIRQRISYARKTTIGPLLRVSYPVFERYGTILAEERKLREQYPNGVPEEALADLVDMSPAVVRKIMDTVKTAQVISLDDTIPGTEEAPISHGSMVPDTNYEEMRELEEMRDQVFAIITRLTPENRRLLCLHFGILEGVENSIDDRERLREQYRQLACKTILASAGARTQELSDMPL